MISSLIKPLKLQPQIQERPEDKHIQHLHLFSELLTLTVFPFKMNLSLTWK